MDVVVLLLRDRAHQLLQFRDQHAQVPDRRREVQQSPLAGRPLWPPPTSTAYAALLRGEAPAVYCTLTWDASTFCWAALAWWWDLAGQDPAARELLLVGTWPARWDVS